MYGNVTVSVWDGLPSTNRLTIGKAPNSEDLATDIMLSENPDWFEIGTSTSSPICAVC